MNTYTITGEELTALRDEIRLLLVSSGNFTGNQLNAVFTLDNALIMIAARGDDPTPGGEAA